MKTVTGIISELEKQGNRIAMIYRTGLRRHSYSYTKIHELSLKAASFLEKKGIKKGDRVLIWAPNSPLWAAVFFGIIARGAVAVPVDFASGRERASLISKLSGCKLIIQSHYKADKLSNAINIEDLEFLLPKCQNGQVVESDENDLAEIMFTSGTTGKPKGVMLTHGNISANVAQVREHMQLPGNLRLLSILPLSHMFEQTAGFLVPLRSKCSIVYIRTLKPSAIVEALSQEKVYGMVCVPRLLQALKQSIEMEFDMQDRKWLLESMLRFSNGKPGWVKKTISLPIRKKMGNFEVFVSGGAPLDIEIARFWENLGFKVAEGYGLTECSPVLTANTIKKRSLGTVGKPLPGVEIKLDDSEILAKGKNVFKGYWKNRQATKDAFTGGWFRTGDIGEFDPEGNLRIKGRKKDVIITSAGVNIHPEDIEKVLDKIPGVVESCVIGRKAKGEEIVHAVLVLKKPENAGEIAKLANERLDPLQQVSEWSTWQGSFPKTTTMKVRRFLVKEKIEKKSPGPDNSPDRLISLIARVSSKPSLKIKETSTLAADLGMDSIARIELVNFIEQEFIMDLEDTLINSTTTVGDLRKIIEKRERISKSRFQYWQATSAGRIVRRALDILFNYPAIRFFVKLQTVGKENLREAKMPALFVSNHVSYIDWGPIMFSLPSKWRYRTATLGRAEFFEGGKGLGKIAKKIMLWYCIANNLFPFPQKRGFREALKHIGKLADRNVSTLIFPEGERSRDGKLLPFQPGLALLVKELQMPVIPLKIEGMEKIFPRGSSFPKRGKATLKIGKPLYFTIETPSEILEKSRQAINNL